ncbi:diguanylate cyclase [Mycolicibacterium phlei]|uniref:GGDEF domain-containing protein n=1 Tax=Mycolicibacterium phlei TaxID=1771 RepID=UPI0037C52D69
MGRDEYEFTTAALRDAGYLRALKIVIAVLCLAMAVLGWLMQLHPLGPQGPVARVIHGAVSTSAVAVGVAWLVGRWPSYRTAVLFVAWADIGLAVAAWVSGAPASQISATTHMTLIGVFAAFLMGWRVLVCHCLFAFGLILALVVRAAVVEHDHWFDLYIYYAPALSTVVGLPVLIQAIVDGSRSAVRRAARDALRDPATGLRNRRGMYAAARASTRRHPAGTVVAAVIDLDNFKEINDSAGHHAGDAALQAVADELRARIRRPHDVAARTGGDEFVVIAVLESADGIDSFVERIDAAMRAASSHVTASVGVAHGTCDAHNLDTVDEVLRRADRAMYQAKRQGGNQLVRA